MRDVVAGLVAIILLLVAASLATTLQWYRRRRKSARESEGAQGRQIIAELPTADDLVFVSEDSTHLYYGDARRFQRNRSSTVRVLINGAPIAAYVSRRHAAEALSAPTSFEDRPEGIARDRWDVAIEAQAGTTLIDVRRDSRAGVAGTGANGVRRRETRPRGTRSPLDFGVARPMIDGPGHDEQQVGQAIDVAQQDARPRAGGARPSPAPPAGTPCARRGAWRRSACRPRE